MTSQPPAAASFSGVAVDDMLAVPEIQDLLATDASTDMQDDANSENESRSGAVGAISEAFTPEDVDFEEKLPEELLSQQTTRSIPEANFTSAGDAPAPGNAQHQEKTRSVPDASNVLPTGQHVQVMSAAELHERCHALQVRTATVGHDKLEKAADRQRKTQIRSLQAELARLHQLETDLKQYEQRPLASLQDELETRQHKIADLSSKLQDAVQEEIDYHSHFQCRVNR